MVYFWKLTDTLVRGSLPNSDVKAFNGYIRLPSTQFPDSSKYSGSGEDENKSRWHKNE
jgi:hypothetical protein